MAIDFPLVPAQPFRLTLPANATVNDAGEVVCDLSNESLDVGDGGLTVAGGGLTIDAGGLTVTAGGIAITAGGQSIVAGNLVLTSGVRLVANLPSAADDAAAAALSPTVPVGGLYHTAGAVKQRLV